MVSDRQKTILFVGGTGVISAACVDEAASQGLRVTVLNRGQTPVQVPDGVERLVADIRDARAVREVLGRREFDVVVNFVAFDREHVKSDIELFDGSVGQYVFISSASAYQTPPSRLPITESTPLRNPYLRYSQAKIEAEEQLLSAYRDGNFPVTIIRPSHTYGPTKVPLDGGWTVLDRMRRGKQIVVHGDGTSLWTLTHRKDFARFFTPLLGNPGTIGDAFHITSDEVLTWNQIYEAMARAAGVEARIVHVPSAAIARVHEQWGAALVGDKAHSLIFDNSKIDDLLRLDRRFVPFEEGAREIVAWHDADPSRKRVDATMDQAIESLVLRFGP